MAAAGIVGPTVPRKTMELNSGGGTRNRRRKRRARLNEKVSPLPPPFSEHRSFPPSFIPVSSRRHPVLKGTVRGLLVAKEVEFFLFLGVFLGGLGAGREG